MFGWPNWHPFRNSPKAISAPMTFSSRLTRYLDAQQVAYKLLPHQEAVYTVEAAAAQRGVVLGEMVKSILLRDRNRRYAMACVLGADRLDPKAVRSTLGDGWKRLSFATADEIEEITGYQKGAVAPLCLPSQVPVLMDHKIAKLKRVNISSGDPLAGIELGAHDLIRLADARLAAISLTG